MDNSTPNRKKVAFQTFGCRLNQYDTESIRTLLSDAGEWEPVSACQPADVYVINTCTVTARADATARQAIRRIIKEQPDAQVVVTGCYAQRAPSEIAELPGVSLIVGAADRGRIAEELRALQPGSPRIAVSPIAQADTFLEVSVTEMMDHSRAVLKVQEGCNNECTFCIVPQTRGVSRSRRPEAVLEQARELVDNGYVEIVLAGVHIGDYGLDLGGQGPSLTTLIEQILAIPGLQRFRLSSIEPASVDDALIDLMSSEESFARHFHIPLQSASEAILSKMKRRYTAQSFRDLIWKIGESVPDCGIGVDVICGFPGETDEDFQRTFDCIADSPVTYVHPFTYSVRPGSEAESFGDQIPAEVKKRRTRALKRLSRDKNRAFRENHIGKSATVLLERKRATKDGAYLSGWTDNYLRVTVLDQGVGEGMCDVRVVELTDDGLRGVWAGA